MSATNSNRWDSFREPLGYLITFACYGARLHGDDSGSVDPAHNLPCTPFVEPTPARVASEHRRMDQPPYLLDSAHRRIVLRTIREVCGYKGCRLFAAHIRVAHVHGVVEAAAAPEAIMNAWKAYASRRLNETGVDSPDRKRWARHGSTRYLWTDDDLAAAVHYVLYEQGEPLDTYSSLASPDSPSEPRPSGSV